MKAERLLNGLPLLIAIAAFLALSGGSATPEFRTDASVVRCDHRADGTTVGSVGGTLLAGKLEDTSTAGNPARKNSGSRDPVNGTPDYGKSSPRPDKPESGKSDAGSRQTGETKS